MWSTYLTATVLLAGSLVSSQSPCQNYPCNKNNQGAHLPCQGDNTKFWLCNQWLGDDIRTGQVIDCCATGDQPLYFNPQTNACEISDDPGTVSPPPPSDCTDPCNQSNQFTKQPCVEDCTKFWMCNQYIPNKKTSILIDCCEDKNGNVWHFDNSTKLCAIGDCSATTTTLKPTTTKTTTVKPTTTKTTTVKPTTTKTTTVKPTTTKTTTVKPTTTKTTTVKPTTTKTTTLRPTTPPICADPCNESNQFTKQPCKGDCTKFWMCNEYVDGQVTSKLIDCCEGKDGVIWYWDPVAEVCSTDEKVCYPTPPPPPVCDDPCNQKNELTLQPCDGDCTKFWMCNEYVPGQVTSSLLDCCEGKDCTVRYWDPVKKECSSNEDVCYPTPPPPPVCADPCNKNNELTLQPCEGDCTKFWMCNEYVDGQVTSKLIDCCEGKDGVIWYWDPIAKVCSTDQYVCNPTTPGITTTTKPTTTKTTTVKPTTTKTTTVKPTTTKTTTVKTTTTKTTTLRPTTAPICADPCNESNQLTLQPCEGDCTKFWMCNEYVDGQVTSKLIDCCEGKDGVIWYWDPIAKVCSTDQYVCNPTTPGITTTTKPTTTKTTTLKTTTTKTTTVKPTTTTTTTTVKPTTTKTTTVKTTTTKTTTLRPTTAPICADPCNESNQLTLQPCEGDCTKFWMCNEYVDGQVTSKLIDCCEGKDGVTWYWDPSTKVCSVDPSVCESTPPPGDCASNNPCNTPKSEFTLVPCEDDCTKFWMCNQYVPGQDTGLLINCCNSTGTYYYDRATESCSPEASVCVLN